MTSRVRLSTVALAVVFAGVLALYVEVRPPPASVAGTSTVETTAPSSDRPAPRSSAPTTTTRATSTVAPPAPGAVTTLPDPSPSATSTPDVGTPRLTATPSSIPSTGAP